MEKYCVGIDVDKHTLKASLIVRTNGKKILSSRTFKNTLSGFSGLLEWVQKSVKVHIKNDQIIKLRRIWN